jgi:hypothetical protein
MAMRGAHVIRDLFFKTSDYAEPSDSCTNRALHRLSILASASTQPEQSLAVEVAAAV